MPSRSSKMASVIKNSFNVLGMRLSSKASTARASELSVADGIAQPRVALELFQLM